MFVQRIAFDPTECYPDGSSVQVYACKPYVELETLSPNKHIQPGQSIEFDVTWSLLDRPTGSSAELLVRTIERAVR